jgi:putative ABC transport system ATP-binding protein
MNNSTLQISHVTKRFGSAGTEVTAVRDVSLEIAPGEIVLIMGPSGSGKTTLLLMLGALLKPTEGSIRLNGFALSELPERRLPDIRLRGFGFVFQDFNLLSSLSVLENVALVAQLAGLKSSEARAKAARLLAELGLEHRLNFLPEKLSGGEKQRVAIARALVNDASLVLADEPTANLDSKIGHEIMRLLRQIAKEQGRSVVIVSHDARIKDIADRVLWLEDGRFKDMVTMQTDPVCGMSVERERAEAAGMLAEHDHQTYYFCSKGCRDEFLAQYRPSRNPLLLLMGLRGRSTGTASAGAAGTRTTGTVGGAGVHLEQTQEAEHDATAPHD